MTQYFYIITSSYIAVSKYDLHNGYLSVWSWICCLRSTQSHTNNSGFDRFNVVNTGNVANNNQQNGQPRAVTEWGYKEKPTKDNYIDSQKERLLDRLHWAAVCFTARWITRKILQQQCWQTERALIR